MAPGFRPGKKSRLWVNTLRLSRVTDTAELKRMSDTIETTVHENDDKNYIAGQRAGDFSFAGIHDGSTADQTAKQVAAMLGSSTPQVWSFTPEGDAIGSICEMWKANQAQLTVTSPAAGRVGMAGGCQPTSAIKVGRVLLPGTVAVSSTAAQTGFDSGVAAGTPGGGRGHFHLTAQSTLTTITVKIQHSSNLGAWADLLTFTTTSTGFQGSTVAGTIKRHTRANITVFTGGAKSVNCLAAFARST